MRKQGHISRSFPSSRHDFADTTSYHSPWTGVTEVSKIFPPNNVCNSLYNTRTCKLTTAHRKHCSRPLRALRSRSYPDSRRHPPRRRAVPVHVRRRRARGGHGDLPRPTQLGGRGLFEDGGRSDRFMRCGRVRGLRCDEVGVDRGGCYAGELAWS